MTESIGIAADSAGEVWALHQNGIVASFAPGARGDAIPKHVMQPALLRAPPYAAIVTGFAIGPR